MASPFSRTLRSLEADTFRRGLVALAGGAALLAVWGLWLFFAKLTIYAVSDTARLEVAQAAFPVVAVSGGRVAALPHRVGDAVTEGEVILELDSEEPMLDVDAARAQEDALSTRLDALQGALASTEAALLSDAATRRAAVALARAALAGAQAAATLADADAARDARLAEGGNVAPADLETSLANARGKRAAADAAAAELTQQQETADQAEKANEATLAGLHGEIDALRAQLAGSDAAVSKAELAVAYTQLRAPADGVLGELDPLQVGAVVLPGAAVATVVPAGTLRVVAQFQPVDALGRIKPGQAARMRLDGFPWTQFGSLAATVTTVSQEPRDGEVRVELAVNADPNAALPLHHALTGTVEVALEQSSPALLTLRAAGRMFAQPPAGP